MEAIAYHCQELFLDWYKHKQNPLYVQRSQNLVIEVPPGSAKSRIVSVCFTAWAWLHCPSWRVICLSSNPRVALRDSLYCRDLIESKWYQDTFRPVWRLRYDQNTKSLFSTTAGGWRRAMGWGSRITGDRGDCLLPDDPSDAQEIESIAKRQSVIDRWDTAISNRVNDLRSSIRLGIMQRLKEDDWAGHVKSQGGWDSLTIPQEYEGNDSPTVFGWTDPRTEIGELMFPKRFPPEILAAEKLRLGAGYAGQHQQRPTAAGGGTFQIRSWKLYNPRTIPAMRRSMLSIDANFKKGSASDYAVISCIGESSDARMVPTVYTQIDRDTGLQIPVMTEQRKYYVFDRWRGKVGYSELKSALRQQVKKHPECSIVIVEEAANGHAIMEELQGEIQGLKGFKPGRDSKIARAAAVAPTQERGDIYLPIAEWAIPTLEAMGLDEISIGDWWDLNPPVSQSNAEHSPIAEWAKEWINEFAMFPNSANDDQVDSLSQAIIWSRANKPAAIAAATPSAVSADPRDRQRMAQSGVADRLRRQRNARR
jgi:predicted phage terminase large subunit-like protein